MLSSLWSLISAASKVGLPDRHLKKQRPAVHRLAGRFYFIRSSKGPAGVSLMLQPAR